MKKQISKREYSTKIRRNLIEGTAKSLNLESKLITNYSFPIAYRFREGGIALKLKSFDLPVEIAF